MASANSNEKGARFEREVCVALSRWQTNDSRDDIYWRSAMSGGRATLASRQGLKRSAQAGDIVALDTIGEVFLSAFFVECKWRKDLEITRWVFGSKTPLDEYWDKPLEQAKELGRRPFVVAKQNRKDPLLLVQAEDFDQLWRASRGELERWAVIDRDGEQVTLCGFRQVLTRCDFKDWLKRESRGKRERL